MEALADFTPGRACSLRENLAINRTGAVARVARQLGVDREHEHVFAVVSDVHVPELLERAQEESGARDKDHGKRDLRHHQSTVQRARGSAGAGASPPS